MFRIEKRVSQKKIIFNVIKKVFGLRKLKVFGLTFFCLEKCIYVKNYKWKTLLIFFREPDSETPTNTSREPSNHEGTFSTLFYSRKFSQVPIFFPSLIFSLDKLSEHLFLGIFPSPKIFNF